VGLVAGDDGLAEEVLDWLPWAERVVVKHGIGTNAAASLHPGRASALIRERAAVAVRRASAGELELPEVATPVAFETEYGRALEADFAALVPGSERLGARVVRYCAADVETAYRGFRAGVHLAGLVD
jgi:D-amino peptidase